MDKAKSGQQAAPLSIRFTDSEKARLKDLAGGKPLGQYIRDRVLDGASATRNRVQAPLKDAEPLGHLLGLLGQSRLASNLNQIAKAANQGSLPVTVELEADLKKACEDISEMRLLLLRALGIKIIDEVKRTSLPVVDFFREAAGTPAE